MLDLHFTPVLYIRLYTLYSNARLTFYTCTVHTTEYIILYSNARLTFYTCTVHTTGYIDSITPDIKV